MKQFTVLAFIIAKLLASLTPVVADAYSDGYKEGQLAAEKLWEDRYNEECDNVYSFTVDVLDGLVNGQYGNKRGNWRVVAENKGGRNGAKEFILQVQENCITPEMCDEIGQTAASIIKGNFCEEGGGMQMQFNKRRTPAAICRKQGIITCEGYMLTKVYESADRGSCRPISNKIKNFSFKELEKQQKKCKRQVEDMIEWNDM